MGNEIWEGSCDKQEGSCDKQEAIRVFAVEGRGSSLGQQLGPEEGDSGSFD